MSLFRLLIATLMCCLLSSPASAAATSCKIRYQVKGWSIFYKQYKGYGTVKCENGQRTKVSITSRGGGLTVGKSEISKGKGIFSTVNNINEIYGTYIVLDGHAGMTKSAEGQVMTKGEVSLAISGTGRGVDLGVAIGAFTIKPI